MLALLDSSVMEVILKASIDGECSFDGGVVHVRALSDGRLIVRIKVYAYDEHSETVIFYGLVHGKCVSCEQKAPYTFTDGLVREPVGDGTLWLEQNSAKASEWGALSRKGHKIWHLVYADKPGYAGKIKVDGEVLTYNQARLRYGVK